MEAEPTDPTLGTSPSLVTNTTGDYHWSQFNNCTWNNTIRADNDWSFFNFGNIVLMMKVLIGFCGAAGNGAVVWLLGFRLKRSPFSVYILNLACSDGACLLSAGVLYTLALLHVHTYEFRTLMRGVCIMSLYVGLGLLMAVSTERCVSVLWPLWYRCRRPAHLSCTMCMLIWGLGLCTATYEGLCVGGVAIPCDGIGWVYDVMVVVTFVMLCVSSLTLVVRVQCGSRGTRPSRLYVTIVLSVLALLLLALPYTVFLFVLKLSSGPVDLNYLLPSLELLLFLNSAVNPVIYFFVGRYRQRPGRTSLREVLQRALQEEEEGLRCRAPTTETSIPLN